MSTPSEEYVLAIDLGTSGPKVAVVSLSGDVPGSAFRPVVSFMVEGQGYEQDPEAVWRAVLEACREALGSSGVTRENICAIVCDSHFFSIYCLGKDGQPAMNLIPWLDRRGTRENLGKAVGFRPDSLWRQLQWFRLHGVPPLASGIDNLSKLRWIKHCRPEVYERTAVFLEPMDFLAHRLTGRACANACSVFPMQVTDNRNPNNIHYAPTLQRYSGIDADKFPELIPLNAEVGTLLPAVATELGLPSEIPVLAGVNDTHAGAIGCGAFQGNHAGIVLGNSGVLTAHTPRKKTDIRTGLFSLPSPLPGRYLVTGECGVAGRSLEHFMDHIIFAEDAFGRISAEYPYARLESAVAGAPPGSNGVLFLPWMRGANMPVEDGNMRGGFLNVSLDSRRPDLARAMLEGIAFLYRHMGEAGQSFTGRRFDHYTLFGGGALSDTWSQIMADVLGLPVHRMARPRLTNCLGLGLLAFHRMGRLSLDDMAARVPIERVFEPDPTWHNLYADRYAAMNLAFHQNRKVFKKLNST